MLRDFKIVLVFLTRLPVPIEGKVSLQDLARASWLFPVVGLLAGAAGGVAYIACSWLYLPPVVGATMAFVVTALLTGALHEDGLADTADALGASTRAKALEVMKDSRIGTFGALALVFATLLKVLSLVQAYPVSHPIYTLAAALALSRGVMPMAMSLLPSAKAEGLAADAGKPSLARAFAALTLGVAVTFLALPPFFALQACLWTLIAAAITAWGLSRRFGGITGDTLGAVEQVAQVVFFMAVASAGLHSG